MEELYPKFTKKICKIYEDKVDFFKILDMFKEMIIFNPEINDYTLTVNKKSYIYKFAEKLNKKHADILYTFIYKKLSTKKIYSYWNSREGIYNYFMKLRIPHKIFIRSVVNDLYERYPNLCDKNALFHVLDFFDNRIKFIRYATKEEKDILEKDCNILVISYNRKLFYVGVGYPWKIWDSSFVAIPLRYTEFEDNMRYFVTYTIKQRAVKNYIVFNNLY